MGELMVCTVVSEEEAGCHPQPQAWWRWIVENTFGHQIWVAIQLRGGVVVVLHSEREVTVASNRLSQEELMWLAERVFNAMSIDGVVATLKAITDAKEVEVRATLVESERGIKTMQLTAVALL